MARRRLKTAAPGEPGSRAANETIALTWLRDFESSGAHSELSRPARLVLEGAVQVMARCFTWRRSGRLSSAYLLDEMSAEDAVEVLTREFPRTVTALDPEAIVDGLVALLTWASKTNRIQNRSVEFVSRQSRRQALAAMQDERGWSPGKSMVMFAMRDGIDPTDLAGVREHAISGGLDERFVDEFLPPGPMSLGNGRWLWI